MIRSDITIKIPFFSRKSVLATGAESKSSFAFLSGNTVLLSRVFDDLRDPAEFEAFKSAISKKSRGSAPQVVAYDLHPDYISTKYAREISEKRKHGHKSFIGVQHHHAHVAACMAENRLRGKAIGVAFDGTGYGSDGNIWGGEFLIADYSGFERSAHLAYVPMPGGDKAVLEPMRMALSYLYKTYGSGIKRVKADVLRRIGKPRYSVFIEMMDRDFNSPLTSSAGRLFDAVSALLGIRDCISFKGEAAIELENTAAEYCDEIYDFKIRSSGKGLILEFWPMIDKIVADLKNRKPVSTISRKFHNTVAEAVKDLACRLRRKRRLSNVVLSGGVFQNRILLSETKRRLKDAGFSVYTHSKTSSSDSSLSLGQAVIAARTAGKAFL